MGRGWSTPGVGVGISSISSSSSSSSSSVVVVTPESSTPPQITRSLSSSPLAGTSGIRSCMQTRGITVSFGGRELTEGEILYRPDQSGAWSNDRSDIARPQIGSRGGYRGRRITRGVTPK